MANKAQDADQAALELFRAVDKDNDKKIEKQELIKLLEMVLEEVPDDSMVSKCMAKFDVDGSGYIEYEEFLELLQDLHAKRRAPITSIFAKYDQDGDGKLNQDEIAWMLINESFIKERDQDKVKQRVQQLLERYDKDKDGNISLSEFVQIVQSY